MMTTEPSPTSLVGRSKWLTHARLEILRRDYPADHPWEGDDGLIERLTAAGGPRLPKKGVIGFVVHSFGLRRPRAEPKQTPPELLIMSDAPAGRTATDRILSAVGRLLARDAMHVNTVPVTEVEVVQYARENGVHADDGSILAAVNAFRAEQEIPPFRVAVPMNPGLMPSSKVGGYQPRRPSVFAMGSAP